MATKVYVTRCIVKRGGKRYEKGSVIEDLSTDEIKKGLSEKWLEAVGNDEEPAKEESAKANSKPKKPSGKKSSEKPLAKTREELIAEAAGLGLMDQITDATTDEEIQKLIATSELTITSGNA